MLAIYCYFKYWDGLKEKEIDEFDDIDNEDPRRRNSSYKKISTKRINDKIEEEVERKKSMIDDEDDSVVGENYTYVEITDEEY